MRWEDHLKAQNIINETVFIEKIKANFQSKFIIFT